MKTFMKVICGLLVVYMFICTVIMTHEVLVGNIKLFKNGKVIDYSRPCVVYDFED